ncbi:MAG: FkbM family methyltransferase [Pseudomonadota bacterium]
MIKTWQRQRAIKRYLDATGGAFLFAGKPVELPPDTVLGLQYAVAQETYERAERDLIDAHLPADLPVIELGGCLGLVSSYIARRLALDVEHIIVEANPALLEICARNAHAHREGVRAQVLHHAVAYGMDEVSFAVRANPHGSRLDDGATKGTRVTVPAVTLSALVAQTLGEGKPFGLICDIEGAEFDLVERDGAALAACQMAIIEVHPDVFEAQGRSLEAFLALAQDAGLKPIAQESQVIAFERVAAAVN